MFLLQAAKNLMNAVVLTVKSCYVASTKYPRLAASMDNANQKPIVVWKMKVRDDQYTEMRIGVVSDVWSRLIVYP